MRRLLAMLLLAAFGLPAVAPALALAPSEDAHIPACCRRNGAHHCAMLDAQKTDAPTITALCPHFPQPSSAAPTGTLAALASPSSLTSLHLVGLTTVQRAETQRRLSRERSRHKRGPPTELL